VPTVTALRADQRGRVAVELDGSPWRLLPTDVVVRAGLVSGRVLDREALRLLRRELRRAEALGIAARALRNRDLSERRLAERLDRAGVPPAAREESLETLARAGLIDDGRFSLNRAEALARRGFGDAAIRHDLAAHGVSGDVAEAALLELDPEGERARGIIDRRGLGPGTARYLAGKGFGEEAVEAALAAGFATDP
jgi:SOS response regulatory protein OraA/RecX